MLLWVDLAVAEERDEPAVLVFFPPEAVLVDLLVVVFLRVSANGTTLSKRAGCRPRNIIILLIVSYSKLCSISREKKPLPYHGPEFLQEETKYNTLSKNALEVIGVKKITGILLVVLCIALLCGGCLRYFRPTHLFFSDRFILGNTASAIAERYGEFDRIYEYETSALVKAEYMIRDNTPELIMSYDNSLWYEICFQDGIAVQVDLREGYPGG